MTALRYVATIALITWLALGAISTILCIGQERKPIQPIAAALNIVLQVGLILAVMTSAGWFEGR